GTLVMPENLADPRLPRRYSLFSRPGIQAFQLLSPDRYDDRPKGRFRLPSCGSARNFGLR
ncbi:MAG TPA: hypothetical protein VE687_14390, partial [Stellaceae bacterium]|nr:hypothetical protein [Stellaceae bacterium]